MSIPGLVYFCLWKLLQLVVAIIDLWRAGIWRLEEWYHRSYDLFMMRQSEDEIAYLTKEKSKLLKLPGHLCITMGQKECYSPKALSKIAFYSLVMGIPCLSFYDPLDKFSLDQLQAPVIVESKRTKNERLLWSMKGATDKLTYKNGTQKTLEIVLIRRKDGKPLIAEVCRELFEQRYKTEIEEALKDRPRLTDIITRSLDEKLHKLPDPDMVIVFNTFLCTFELLPWHTRFTEFHLVDRGSYFNAKMFAKVLFKFSKCEQRYGR